MAASSTTVTKNPNVVELSSKALTHLFTKIRDARTSPEDFKRYADRLMRILAEEGIARLDTSSEPTVVTTPTGDQYVGSTAFTSGRESACVVSIIRAGDSLLDAVIACEPSLAVGKILIQRDENSDDKHPVLYYSKFPPKIANMNVILVDPMLATGGSAIKAIETLLAAGVNQSRILFLNVVACPEGLEALSEVYPDVSVVTAAIDSGLNESKYIVPGLGDYGDRYFNTV